MSNPFGDPPPKLPLDVALRPDVFRAMIRQAAARPGITGVFVLDGSRVVHRNRLGEDRG